MQLHQLLRLLDNVTPIVLLTSTNRILYQGFKNGLSTDYYEEYVYKMFISTVEGVGQTWPALHIMMFK